MRLAFSQHRDSAVFFAELGEQELIQKGIKRFSVRNRVTPPGGLYILATPPSRFNERRAGRQACAQNTANFCSGSV